MLLPALYAGLVNYRVIRPELMALVQCNSISGPSVFQRFGRMLELEVTIGLLVVALAGILASIPPPGSNSTLRLTDRQVGALITPQLPTGNIPNPAGFYGAPKRTLDDLRYSEFTHHFSGKLVSGLLGFAGWDKAGAERWGAGADEPGPGFWCRSRLSSPWRVIQRFGGSIGFRPGARSPNHKLLGATTGSAVLILALACGWAGGTKDNQNGCVPWDMPFRLS